MTMQRRAFLSLAGIGAIGGGAYLLTRPAGPGETLIPAAQAQSSNVDTSAVQEMVQGNPDAPVELIEYASFTCPHCATFHANQYPQLKAEFIDPGRIKFVYREVYFDRPGLWASMVARCDPIRFFGISEMLYARQREWTEGDGAQIAANLRRIGIAAGLDEAAVDACMSDADMAQTLVAWYEENVEEHNVRATPTLVINGETKSNMSYPELKALLDEALAS
ncbi:DsbA family protein [Aestuariibius sp. 2305UL40-4]|uniref:DsbA family protein n=1 Tax=Aestuariibius violaceus TaxID=3234132 RepID=UPI00345E4CAE